MKTFTLLFGALLFSSTLSSQNCHNFTRTILNTDIAVHPENFTPQAIGTLTVSGSNLSLVLNTGTIFTAVEGSVQMILDDDNDIEGENEGLIILAGCNVPTIILGNIHTYSGQSTGFGVGIENNRIRFFCNSGSTCVDLNGMNSSWNVSIPTQNWYPDLDGDGFGDATAVAIADWVPPQGYVTNNLDCNDADPFLSPNTTWYNDTDQDGYGDENDATQSCTQPSGYIRDCIFDECPTVLYLGNFGCPVGTNPIVSSESMNFIHSVIPTIQTASLQDNTPSVRKTEYFDGLGRPIQTVNIRASPAGSDLISQVSYDEAGRKTRDFLPYPANQSSGKYSSTASSDVFAYYSNNAPALTNYPFSESEPENSALSRVLSQAAPGDNWAMGSGHEVKFVYSSNGTNEVRLFSAIATWDNESKYVPSFSQNGSLFYDPGKLYKTITRDENWTAQSDPDHSTEEFKDKEGRVVLKRSYTDGEAHDTYYVYDQYDNLTYVFPPQVDLSSISTQLDGLCYQYIYDNRNRVVEKKVPGKQWEFIVYDRLNRVVANGPSFSPFSDQLDSQSGWLITKFDTFNRPILTAWMTGEATSQGRSILQSLYNSDTVVSEAKTGNSSSAPYAIYSTNARPSSGFNLLTLNYYDDYDFPGAPTSFGNILSDGTQVVYYNQTIKPKGLLTGNWVRVLQTSTGHPAEITSLLYDNKARLVAEYKKNYLDGYTNKEYKIDFSGKVIVSEVRHKRVLNDAELFIKETFIYTEQDRLLSHMHQIGSGGTPQLMSFNRYESIGQLSSKSVGGTDSSGSNRLQQIDYSYNIRGWLKDINPDYDCHGCTSDDLFQFSIKYDDPDNLNVHVTPLYNGNISETYWKGTGSPVWRKYGYEYDGLNRLLHAGYQKVSEEMPNGNYDEALSYDKNGNILSLVRNGDIDATFLPIQIDDLSYSYAADSNRLMDVEDFSANSSGFSDEGDPNVADYLYDANGNMTKDANKGVDFIFYNHMNLPVQINFSTGSKIYYRYNALGEKVMKQIVTSSATTTVDYFDGFQYKDTKLEFFPHAEGYVRNTPINGVDNFNYVFQYKDHLGNIRMNFALDPDTNEVEVLEENHYYPFGLKHANYSTGRLDFREEQQSVVLKAPAPSDPPAVQLPLDYNYKYNGKEFQDELGLNLYDYGARNYDPALGRFFNVDRMAEMFMNLSPYQYANNTPTFFIDVNGEYIYINDPNSDAKYRYQNGQTQHQVDGKWQTIDANTVLPDFVLNTVAGLNGLENSGKTGAGLVGKFSGEGMDVTFQYRALKDGGNEAVFAGAQGLKENTIFFDDKKSQGAFTTAGYLDTLNFVTIGHEMSHLTGIRYEDSWFGNGRPPSKSEIRASHYENMIRAESGLPLRTHYGETFDRATGKTIPNAKTTLIDRAGNSVYYSHDPKRMYPGTLPSLINDGINANNGRILTGRYNYNSGN